MTSVATTEQSQKPYVVGVDLGGTNVRAAVLERATEKIGACDNGLGDKDNAFVSPTYNSSYSGYTSGQNGQTNILHYSALAGAATLTLPGRVYAVADDERGGGADGRAGSSPTPPPPTPSPSTWGARHPTRPCRGSRTSWSGNTARPASSGCRPSRRATTCLTSGPSPERLSKHGNRLPRLAHPAAPTRTLPTMSAALVRSQMRRQAGTGTTSAKQPKPVSCAVTVTPPTGQGLPFTVTPTQQVTVMVPEVQAFGEGGYMPDRPQHWRPSSSKRHRPAILWLVWIGMPLSPPHLRQHLGRAGLRWCR